MEPFYKDLVKHLLVELLTLLAPNLPIAITSYFRVLKQKSISSLKMNNNLS